jgi:hypothetical protein
MIQANCRARFTAEDFDFIVRTLSKCGSDRVSLSELLSDADTRDAILDHERLLQAVLEDAHRLTISPGFYFYVLIRHVMKSAGLTSRELSDYVASVLEAFSRTARMLRPDAAVGNATPYISDLLLALRDASPQQSFIIRAHVGNFSLFISGIFHECVRRRSTRGAPDLSFYEMMGSQSFRSASDHRMARECELQTVYRDLSECFSDVRRALARLSDEYINLDDDLYAKQIPPGH